MTKQERTINQMILDKIEERTMPENVRQFIKEILQLERKNLYLGGVQYSKDYDNLINRYKSKEKE